MNGNPILDIMVPEGLCSSPSSAHCGDAGREPQEEDCQNREQVGKGSGFPWSGAGVVARRP